MDDGSPIGLLVAFGFCLLCSFFFSGTETAFTSVNRVRMRGLAEKGDARAARVVRILDQFDQALTTLLIGNNIVNISAATFATIFATFIWGEASVTLVTLVVTVIVFLFAETVPKTFAKACNAQFAMAVAGVVLFLMKTFRPLVFVFSKVTDWISKPFRKGKRPLTVTEMELRDIIDDAVEEGALDVETGELVRAAIQYTDATVRDILTPWKDVRKLPEDMPHEAVLEVLRETGHSRLPVIDHSGNVVGMLRVRRYLKATLRGKAPVSLSEIMEPVHSIVDTVSVDELLPMMSNQRVHFTLVRDEWENVLGIVTVEDILERLVGDIYDEDDEYILSGEGGELA